MCTAVGWLLKGAEAKPCSRHMKEVGDASYLEVFNARMDGAWSNLIEFEVSLPTAGGWN